MKNFEDEDEDLMKFSWLGFFSVTAICFYLFGFFMWFLEGDHVLLFLKIGTVCMVLASLAYMHKHSSQKNPKKITGEKVSIFNED